MAKAKKVVDKTDGVAYTKAQFIEFYGEKKANKIWESAANKAEAEPKSKAQPKAKVKAKAKAKVKAAKERKPKEVTIGYHRIRGLGAPLRMMCYYRAQDFEDVAYGNDMKEEWFGKAKPELLEKNSCINLPYVKVGNTLVTQSNTCLLFLGKVLGVDRPSSFIANHTVLDQVMDWRNDLMKIVYPFAGVVKEKAQFPEEAKKHLEGTTKTNMTKLEGFCKGTFMCGKEPQSGDFHVFEMLDQHLSIAASVGGGDIFEGFPKLKALHTAMKEDKKLAKYFESDCYKKFAQNNGLITHYTGQGADFEYGPTVTRKVSFK